MKRILPTVFILALAGIAWVTGPLIPQHMTPALLFVLLGMFPGILIALIALFASGKRPVIPSEFSRPLQPFDGPAEGPHRRSR